MLFCIFYRIRDSTYERLKLLSNGVLGTALSQILSRDPIAPVLWERHYAALDMRLNVMVLQQIDKCIRKYGESYVIVFDEQPRLQQ